MFHRRVTYVMSSAQATRYQKRQEPGISPRPVPSACFALLSYRRLRSSTASLVWLSNTLPPGVARLPPSTLVIGSGSSVTPRRPDGGTPVPLLDVALRLVLEDPRPTVVVLDRAGVLPRPMRDEARPAYP